MRLGKRKVVWLVIVATCGVIAVVFWLLTREPADALNASYDRIELGMTLAECESVVGLKPGDYMDRSFRLTKINPMVRSEFSERRSPNATDVEWETNAGSIWIWLDNDGKVERKVLNRFEGHHKWRERLPDWLRRWIPN